MQEIKVLKIFSDSNSSSLNNSELRKTIIEFLEVIVQLFQYSEVTDFMKLFVAFKVFQVNNSFTFTNLMSITKHKTLFLVVFMLVFYSF